MYIKKSLTILATAVGLGLTLILLVGLHPVRATPNSNDWFIRPDGSGTACTQSAPCGLKPATDNAADNDILYLSGGVYTSTESAVLKITKSITVTGGWNGLTGALVVDPDVYPSILDGENARRVVYMTPLVTPTLEGLTLQQGNAVGQGGDSSIPGADVGGGVYAYDASPTISNCIVISSTAGFGAGLALYKGTPVVINNEVENNVATQNVASITRGVGGGMLLYQSGGVVTNNYIANNSANGTQVYDGGGGVYVDGSTTLISDNTIQGNYGHRGGGLFIYMSAIDIRDNTILGNSGGLGGGVFLMSSPANFEANMVLANSSSAAGGGFAIFDSINFTLTNNIVAQNFGAYPAGMVASALFDGLSSQGVLVHNTFADNNAPPNPWEILLGNGPLRTANLILTNNIIGLPGGVYVDTGSMATANTTYWDKIPIGVELNGPGTIISSTNIYGNADYVGQYHISPNSTAIDQGTNAGIMDDIDGETRPNGFKPDIGADEFYCYALSAINILGPSEEVFGHVITFNTTVLPPTATIPITFTWQATGQASITHSLYSVSDTMTYTWPVTGTQTITVSAANCGGSVTNTHMITLYTSRVFLPLVLRQ